MNLDRYAASRSLLMVGSPVKGLTTLTAGSTRTLATTSTGRPTDRTSTLFATPFTDVAIFAAAVWSRDGWSGWHTYMAGEWDLPEWKLRDWQPGADIWHEFFAISAVQCQAADGPGGSVYLVGKGWFVRYREIPGQYVLNPRYLSTPIPVVEEHPVRITDMETEVYSAHHVHRGRKAVRPGRANWPDRLERIRRVPDPRNGQPPGDSPAWTHYWLQQRNQG
jgi:hypothetical protein